MNKKWIIYAGCALIFLVGGFWIYSTLATSFQNLSTGNRLTEIEVFSNTFSAIPDSVQEHLTSSPSFLPGATVLYFIYNFDENTFTLFDENGVNANEIENTLSTLWYDRASSSEFQQAIESVYYGEIFTLAQGDETSLYFVPVMDEEGFEVQGMLLVWYPASEVSPYILLLRMMCIGFCVVCIIFSIIYIFLQKKYGFFQDKKIKLAVLSAVFIVCDLIIYIILSSTVHRILSIATPSEMIDSYISLLRSLLFIAALLFVISAAIALFARDTFSGFAVLGLYIIAAVFIAYPLFEALRLTFMENGSLTVSVWTQVLSKSSLIALWGSLKLGILTATFSTLIGFLFAFAVERTAMRGKKFVSLMATMPVISPPFSLTLSIILLAGNNGLITNQFLHLKNFSIYGLNGLVLVQTIGMFPIAFMTLQGILRSIDSTVEDASLDLNATRLQTFWRVTLPLAMPGIMSAWLLVFTNSLADFANPLLLSGDYRVLSVEAYIAVTGRNNLGLGAGLSILLLLPTLTAFFAQRYWVNKRSFVTVTGKPSTRLTELTSPAVRTSISVFLYIIVILIIALYGTIFAGCFVKNWGIDYTFTLSNIFEALSRGKQAIFDTLTLAAFATPIAGILSMLAALLIVRKTFAGKRFLEVLIMTPYAVPGTLIGIAYILAFNKPPLILVGTGLIIVINYVIRELPVGVETGISSLRQIDTAIEESAADLGADSATIFRTIVLPLIRPAFLTSMTYTFVRSMTAVSAIIFLISARWYHLTVQIYNFSENLRFGLASVLSTVLILIILAVFGLLHILVPDKGLTEKTISR